MNLPPSGVVRSTHLLKVSTDLPKDTFDMTTLYKPIIDLGGGICHIFEVKYVKSSEGHIFEFKYVNSSKNHIVLFIIFENKGFTTAVDERKAEVAISRIEDNGTIDYYTIDLGHFSSTLSITGDLIAQHETIQISNVYNKNCCFNLFL